MIIFSYYHILERITRLERGMVNIHDQMRIGFAHISSELRSLSSSVQPDLNLDNEFPIQLEDQLIIDLMKMTIMTIIMLTMIKKKLSRKLIPYMKIFTQKGKMNMRTVNCRKRRRNNSLREREKKLRFILLICHYACVILL